RHVAKYALGVDAGEIDGIVDRCIEGEYKFPGSYVCRALAGVETALWDLRGKREGKSVCELLAAEGRDAASPEGSFSVSPRLRVSASPLPVYGSSMRRDITPEEEARRLARLREAHGFR